MDVKLYVYDLSRGMARTMSQQLLGIQIDAVYHTSLVFNNVEYFFGAGVQTCYPGSTHHGQPMEVVDMGKTQLPMDTILEYLDGLKEVYTPESYDLFAHNCNNFTNDFGMFLVGKGIPSHITNLPTRVLDTPFGQMFRQQMDGAMRSITQVDVPPNNRPTPPSNGTATSSVPLQVKTTGGYGKVIHVTELAAFNNHMSNASHSCAVVFFTSATCAPCRLAYPMFDNLAEEHQQALFLKVDINDARDVAMKFQIRGTPTFMTFLKGAKDDEWTGADPSILKANVRNLLEKAFPPHPHLRLSVPKLQFGSLKPITYVRVPPLEKLISKLGAAANEPAYTALRTFVDKRTADPRNATLPDLTNVSRAFQTKVLALPQEVRFAAIDLLRCAMVDPRISGYYAEEPAFSTMSRLITHVNELQDCPHNLRLVTVHLACNVFSSALFIKELMQQQNALAPMVVQLVASSLLDATHPTTRVAAASLAFNLAAANYRVRREEAREGLTDASQVELVASLIETLSIEESSDAAKVMLLALGYLIYCAPQDGDSVDLCGALDARTTINKCKFHGDIAKEVASLV